MKEFIKQNFVTIVLIFVILTFLKGCNDSRRLSGLETKFASFKDSVATKYDIRVINESIIETRNTLWGFGDSYMTLLNITGEAKIENKSSKKANEMFLNNMKEVKKEKNK